MIRSEDEEARAVDYLARDIIDVPLQQPVGFVWKPRIRVKAISRNQGQPEMAKKSSKPMKPKPGCRS